MTSTGTIDTALYVTPRDVAKSTSFAADRDAAKTAGLTAERRAETLLVDEKAHRPLEVVKADTRASDSAAQAQTAAESRVQSDRTATTGLDVSA